MKSLTNEQQKSYENAKICYFGKEKFENKYRGAAHSTCSLKYSVPREVPLVFHNRSMIIIL